MWHEAGERDEYGRGKDLPGLHALQAEASEEAAPAQRSVFQDHRAGAGDLAGHRETLNQAQHDQQDRGQDADLLIGRQDADSHGRKSHQEHAEQQHLLAAMRVTVMSQDEGTDRAGDIADAVGRQRSDDGRGRVGRRKEDLRENQRCRGRIDEEVIILES